MVFSIALSFTVRRCPLQSASLGGEHGGESSQEAHGQSGRDHRRAGPPFRRRRALPQRDAIGRALLVVHVEEGRQAPRDGARLGRKCEPRRARELANECRAQVAAGLDPIDARDAAAEIKREKPTFGAIADALIASKESEWRNEKHRAQWRASLTEFAAPLRSRPVDEIDTAAILAVLTPLWQTKPETASRVRGRIEAVLDAAKAQGHRSGENPAAWRGHLSHLLPKRGKLTRGHHAAMAYRGNSGFHRELRNDDTIAAMALEFCILTATRSGEVYGARWSEIDISAKVWTMPAGPHEGGARASRPLVGRVLAILEKLARRSRPGISCFQALAAEATVSCGDGEGLCAATA